MVKVDEVRVFCWFETSPAALAAAAGCVHTAATFSRVFGPRFACGLSCGIDEGEVRRVYADMGRYMREGEERAIHVNGSGSVCCVCQVIIRGACTS